VELTLASVPANVPLVRGAIGGLAEYAGFDEATLDDILTAASEAINNVVLHAYTDAVGAVEVQLSVGAGVVEAVVRDHGCGITPHVGTDDPDDSGPHGVGLAAIQAFSRRVALSGAPGVGTEIRMLFDAPGVRSLPAPATSGRGPAVAVIRSEVRVTVRPPALARCVLTRVVGALAARAGFTIDRLSDAELLASDVAAAAGNGLALPELDVGIMTDRRRLELRIGPLERGAAERLVARTAPVGGHSLIERLADEVRIEPADDGTVLTLGMLDDR
jgi:serine/threonine-protein kinase RsbW